jgi:hypothetical protein
MFLMCPDVANLFALSLHDYTTSYPLHTVSLITTINSFYFINVIVIWTYEKRLIDTIGYTE